MFTQTEFGYKFEILSSGLEQDVQIALVSNKNNLTKFFSGEV